MLLPRSSLRWQLIGSCEKCPAILFTAYQTGAYSIALRGVNLAVPNSGEVPKKAPKPEPTRVIKRRNSSIFGPSNDE
jgi:hypothetical protein